MEILQIRKNNKTASTYMAAEITNIRLDCEHSTNTISIYWGKNKMITELYGDDFTEMQSLYNSLLSAATDHSVTSAFIVNVETNLNNELRVKNWVYKESYTMKDLHLPTEKKYKVALEYGYRVDVDVTASTKEEAYNKATEKIKTGEYADDVNDAVGDSVEIKHRVTEL